MVPADRRVLVLGRRSSLLVRSFVLLLSTAGFRAGTIRAGRMHHAMDDLAAMLVCDETGARQAAIVAGVRRRGHDVVVVALDDVISAQADVRLPSTADLDDLLRALRLVAPGDRASSIIPRTLSRTPAAGRGWLTERERQVAALLIEGTPSAQIADELGISVNTVRTHVQNIMSKLGVNSRLEIAGVIAQHSRVSA